MAPTDPIPAASPRKADADIKPDDPAKSSSTFDGMTPKKRKPITSSLAGTNEDRVEGQEGPSSSSPSAPSTRSKASESWPSYSAAEDPVVKVEPGLFSPPPDRSMQPPRHRGTSSSIKSSNNKAHNSHDQSSEKPTQTSATTTTTTGPNIDPPAQAPASCLESMEEEEMGGTDILSLSLPLGSFAEDSPPRQTRPEGDAANATNSIGKPKRSPRASPSSSYPPPPTYGGYPPPSHHHHPGQQHAPLPPFYSSKSPHRSHQSYAGSMYYGGAAPQPKGRGGDAAAPQPPPPPPHHYHHYPPPPSHHYRYYPPPYGGGGGGPPPPADPWNSPPAYDAADFNKEPGPASGSGGPVAPSNAQEAFRSSPGHRSSSPQPPQTIADDDNEVDCRDKTGNSTPEKVKMRSPFRSPPLSQTKKSPMFRSPGLGGYGSFGMMDTPGGTLAAEFSPMGPMLGKDPFGTGYPTPPQLSLSRSSSDDNIEDVPTTDTEKVATSPFSGFLQDFPAFKAATTAPSVTSGGLQGVSRSPLLSEKRKAAAAAAAESGMTQPRRDAATKILASPMGPANGTKPRKLWNSSNDSGPMRLELGGSSSLKKSLEGINTMMRGSQPPPPPPPMATPSTTASQPSSFSRLPPQTNYRRLNTPIKLDPSPVQTSKVAASANNKRSNPSTASKLQRESKLSRTGGGKENLTATGTKRSPCNCKKSRCLKLYCECFANELFCDGCNCTDCQNTTAFASVREKAMKDTRAKNPNAFKPRFSVKGGGVSIAGASPQSGHNMGCRCKRSECLKKYCECFQAGVMCGAKCKCVDCMNFAGSQKLIDKRRKIKDQRGAELAMKVAEQAWKGPHQSQHHSARKMPVSRPAVHSMRPLPSPLGTPSSRLPPPLPPHGMHMHPSPGHGPPPYMRGGYPWGFSPMHVSPSAYGMYPPHHPPHHPLPPPPSTSLPSSASKKATPPSAAKNSRKAEMVEMPYAKAVSSSSSSSSVEKKRTSKAKTPSVKTEPIEATKEGDEAVKKSPSISKAHPTPGPVEKPDSSVLQPTPLETKTKAGGSALITPSPAGRLAYNQSKTKTTTRKTRSTTAQTSVEDCFGSLPNLPRTGKLNILSYLPKKDLASAARVNKGWNKLAKEL